MVNGHPAARSYECNLCQAVLFNGKMLHRLKNMAIESILNLFSTNFDLCYRTNPFIHIYQYLVPRKVNTVESTE